MPTAMHSATPTQKKNRKIPAIMATQHPDNAAAPYWEKDGDGFVSAGEEVAEAYSAYSDLNVDEYMWDWEGKYVDEAVIERLFTEYYKYFQKHDLGKDQFLTFRIPNTWEERGYSLARAYMAMLTAAEMAKDLGMKQRPLFEAILPMTKSAKQLMHIQETFTALAAAKHRLFDDNTKGFDYIEMIPLVESVDEMITIRSLLEEYRVLHKETYKEDFSYIRPFLARSDPALVAGLIPAMIGNKVAISEMYQWGDEHGISVYPIIGTGSLPFRGSCSPKYIDKFIKEYAGIRTVTTQSAFRYDYPLATVKRAMKTLQRELPKQTPEMFTPEEVVQLDVIAKRSERQYRSSVTGVASDLFRITPFVPKRRERRLHVGLLSYSRKIGKQEFPRAITFTAAMYSLGVPPEFIGTGRTLRSLKGNEEALLHKVYKNMEHDIQRCGSYLNIENLDLLARRHPGWKAIKQDIEFIEQYFGVHLGPQSTHEYLHRNATSDIYYKSRKRQDVSQDVLRAGLLRRSLG